MKFSLHRPALVLAALVLGALAFGGCASDPSSGVPDTGSRREVGVEDVRRDTIGSDVGNDTTVEPDVPVTGRARLEFVSDQVQALVVDQRLSLQVRYVGANDAPVADAQIAFAYDEVRAAGSRLRSLTARTDEDGVATVELQAGPVVAEFEIEATVREDPEVAPIEFFVTVVPKESADYLINVFYEGGLTLQDADVLLFSSPGGCADVGRNPDDVFGALDQVSLVPLSDGSFPETPYAVSTRDEPLTYAVGIAFKEDVPVAMGCVDGLPEEIPPGSNTPVDIYLTELFPSIQGEFRVLNEFDVLEFLPGTVQDVVRYIGSFFDSPGHTIFDILSDFGVFDAEDDLPFGLGDLLADAIDALLFEFLPPEAVAVFESGADIYDALQNIQLQGSMIFFEDADERGVLGACNEIILDEIIVDFDTFEVPTLNLRSYGYQGAYGTFTGWIEAVETRGNISYELNVQQYSLEINYGELAVFILETIVFPTVFDDPSINSMEAFVESFIDCEAIADDIGWGAIESLCGSIISAAVDGLRSYLTSQTVDVSSFYVLATPAAGSSPPDGVELLEEGMEWAPCELTAEPDGSAFRVELLGGPDRERCIWDARFRTDESDPVGNPVPAAFDAYRLSTRANGTCGDGQ